LFCPYFFKPLFNARRFRNERLYPHGKKRKLRKKMCSYAHTSLFVPSYAFSRRQKRTSAAKTHQTTHERGKNAGCARAKADKSRRYEDKRNGRLTLKTRK